MTHFGIQIIALHEPVNRTEHIRFSSGIAQHIHADELAKVPQSHCKSQYKVLDSP